MGWLVDGMNVIGCVPDGWWRDRTGAMARLAGALGPLAATDGPVELVLDGRERDLGGLPAGVTVAWAPAPGRNAADDVLAERVRTLTDPECWRVATSDRALAARVGSHGVHVVGAKEFRARIGM